MVMTKFVHASKLSEWLWAHAGICYGRKVPVTPDEEFANLNANQILNKIPSGSFGLIGSNEEITSREDALQLYKLTQAIRLIHASNGQPHP